MSTPPPLNYRPRSCFTSDGKPKVRFNSRAEARAHERMLKARYPDNKPVDPYRCEVCNYFHLGTYPKADVARANKRRKHHEEDFDPGSRGDSRLLGSPDGLTVSGPPNLPEEGTTRPER
jgi:hypothetical protein